MSKDAPLPPPPTDLPRRGDAFRHWKGTVYVVTGRSRNEADPSQFDILYLPEGVSDDVEIPWRRTYADFMSFLTPPPGGEGKLDRRFAPIGRREIPSTTARPALRRELVVFASAMEEKLRANEHKGGWKNEHPFDMLERVVEETDELDMAIQALDSDRSSPDKVAKVLSEAADVANFCMFVADVCGSLGEVPAVVSK